MMENIAKEQRGKFTFTRVGIFILAVGICFIAAGIGSLFTFTSVSTWYPTLIKPPFAPPSWVFGPAWTILYLLMGISLFLVLEKDMDRPEVKQGVSLFSIQLCLNVIWSLLFFGLRSPFLALIGILLLWGSIAATLIQFLKISRPAAYLLIPYLLWVTFAMILNAAIFILNP
ncbi:MAG: tryptophan-rich sensory protein [Methanomicrobiales archaeon]|nr:tryptophan-rich sensory protein [Methanomicrobiales archaeon]